MTLNNYQEGAIESIIDSIGTMAQYVLGREVGKEGTRHIQGYIRFKNPLDFKRVKEMMPKAHIEKAKGNVKQNYAYCSKDGDFVSNIDFRSPLDKMKEEILEAEYKDVKWRPWQQKVLDIVEAKPSKRKIHWFCESEGNVGKSYLCKYIALTRPVIICEGKKTDIFNQVLEAIKAGKAPTIILLDIPRTSNEYINYGAIEQIKNRS